MNTWKFYSGALIPACEPHKAPNLEVLSSGELWKAHKNALLARYTTDFDCGYETSWWYVIKDTPFDISKIKAKRRYEINKGNKFFDVRPIKTEEYTEAIYEVQVEAFKAYPEKYRPTVYHDKFTDEIKAWDTDPKIKVYGAFFKETEKLCGYAMLAEDGRVIHFNVLKTIPEYEKYAINAAIVNKLLLDLNEDIANGKYICDGARAINHETAFQDYLEKYFEFKKAYCVLHLKYRGPVRIIVKCAYPFRKILKKLDTVSLVHRINAVLKMEEIKRTNIKKEEKSI